MVQKYKKLIIALIVVAAIPLLVLMCCDISVKPAGETGETETVEETVDPLDPAGLVTFDTEKGLTIHMSADMEESRSGDHTVYYFSEDCMVSVKMIGFDELVEAGTGNSDTALEEYIQMVEDGNENITFTTDGYGNPCTTYSAEGDKGTFAYYVTVRKGSEAFWMLNFACPEADKALYVPQFELWASTIEVK